MPADALATLGARASESMVDPQSQNISSSASEELTSVNLVAIGSGISL